MPEEDDLKTRFTIKMTFGESAEAKTLSPESGLDCLKNPMFCIAVAGAGIAGFAESAAIMTSGILVAAAAALPVIRSTLREMRGSVNHNGPAPLSTDR